MFSTKVSIIIPCFNDGKYLLESVASARAQTYPNIEVIVIDDHSTDQNTQEVLDLLSKKGTVVLKNAERKKGPSSARNFGILRSTGLFILPLDADDTIDPTYIEKGLAVLLEKPEVGICYCKARLCGLKRGLWKLPPYSWETMLYGNMIFATALFRKTDWELVGGYDEALIHGFEDYAFWMQLIALGRKVKQLDEVLFNYRVKPHSRTAILDSHGNKEKALQGVYTSCEALLREMCFQCFVLCIV